MVKEADGTLKLVLTDPETGDTAFCRSEVKKTACGLLTEERLSFSEGDGIAADHGLIITEGLRRIMA